MSDYIERMKIEHNELKDKKEKLDAFIESEKFSELDFRNQRLLIEQCAHMKNYLDTLSARLWIAHGNK